MTAPTSASSGLKSCQLLIDNNSNHVPWIFVNGIRANLASKELLALLKQAGLKRTAFGVESGDPDILKASTRRSTTTPFARHSRTPRKSAWRPSAS